MSKHLYVERDENGAVVAVYANPQPGFAEEALPHDHPGLARAAPLWMAIRHERTLRLAASDWTQLPDAPLGEAAKAAWAAYRRMLRAIPAAAETPGDVIWPDPPAKETFP
jgi:hypothetical protein